MAIFVYGDYSLKKISIDPITDSDKRYVLMLTQKTDIYDAVILTTYKIC